MNSHQISRTSDFDPFHFAGVTSHVNLNRAAADLAVFNGRKTPLRRVGERRKCGATVGAGHLDLFFEVHKDDLKREVQEGHEVFSEKCTFLGAVTFGGLREARPKYGAKS